MVFYSFLINIFLSQGCYCYVNVFVWRYILLGCILWHYPVMESLYLIGDQKYECDILFKGHSFL